MAARRCLLAGGLNLVLSIVNAMRTFAHSQPVMVLLSPSWLVDANNRGVALFASGTYGAAEALFVQANVKLIRLYGSIESSDGSTRVALLTESSMVVEADPDTYFDEGIENVHTQVESLTLDQRIDTVRATLWFNLAQAKSKLGDTARACACFFNAMDAATTSLLPPIPESTEQTVAHLARLSEQTSDAVTRLILPALSHVGYLSYRSNNLDLAMTTYGIALTHAMSFCGTQSYTFASTLNSLGVVHLRRAAVTQSQHNADAECALWCFTEAMQIFTQCAGGTESVVVARTLNNMARVQLHCGRYHLALPLGQQAQSIYKRTVGHQSIEYAVALFNVGQAFHGVGETNKALACYFLFVNHVEVKRYKRDVIAGLFGVALIYEEHRDFKKAQDTYTASLDIGRSVWGHEQPRDMLALLDRVGKFYATQEKWRPALQIYQEALSVAHSLVDPSEAMAAIMSFMGDIYIQKSKFRSALQVYKKVLALLQVHHGRTSVPASNVLYILGEIHQERGRDDAALTCFQESLIQWQTIHGDNHFELARPLTAIGLLLVRKRVHREALQVLEKAHQIQQVHRGINHQKTALAVYNIGLCYMDQGEYKESMVCFKESLRANTISLGDSHANLLPTLRKLGEACNKEGNLDQALVCFKQALSIEKRRQPENSARIAAILNDIASVYLGQRQVGPMMEYLIAAGRQHCAAGRSISAVVIPPCWWLYIVVVNGAACA